MAEKTPSKRSGREKRLMSITTMMFHGRSTAPRRRERMLGNTKVATALKKSIVGPWNIKNVSRHNGVIE